MTPRDAHQPSSPSKRPHSEPPSNHSSSRPPPPKRRKKSGAHVTRRSQKSYWDSLSRIDLTSAALKEHDRRLQPRSDLSGTTLVADQECFTGGLKQYARQGGPEVTEVRGYPEPKGPTISLFTGDMSAAKKQKLSHEKSSSKRTSVYDANFRRHMIDARIYPVDEEMGEPLNMNALKIMLKGPQLPLASLQITEATFLQFKEEHKKAITHTDVVTQVIPVILGASPSPSVRNAHFTNMKPMTGTNPAELQPDHYDGVNPSDVPKKIRDTLSVYIEPHKSKNYPCLPNFFVEGKGKGDRQTPEQGRLQALHDGAVGERAMTKIALYANKDPYGNAHTISAVYQAGDAVLEMICTHVVSIEGQSQVEYRQTLLGKWIMDYKIEDFREAVTALRSARAWAHQQRAAAIDDAIKTTNPFTDLISDTETHDNTDADEDDDSETTDDDSETADVGQGAGRGNNRGGQRGRPPARGRGAGRGGISGPRGGRQRRNTGGAAEGRMHSFCDGNDPV